FDLPEGRWFVLSVRQRFSSSNPVSEVRVDGNLVASSTAKNFNGRTIERIRYGIVAISANQQKHSLRLWFDEARAMPTGSQSTPTPTPTPEPTPTPTPTPPPTPAPAPQPQPAPQPTNRAPTVEITRP